VRKLVGTISRKKETKLVWFAKDVDILSISGEGFVGAKNAKNVEVAHP